jgi:acyl-CoA thioesterase-1
LKVILSEHHRANEGMPEYEPFVTAPLDFPQIVLILLHCMQNPLTKGARLNHIPTNTAPTRATAKTAPDTSRYQWLLTALTLITAIFFLTATAFADEPNTILALGDSLTAGYGLPQADGFTPQLQARLRADGLNVIVQNAGVSGDTTAGGRARLDWVMRGPIAGAIVELGANDAMRGLAPKQAYDNLDDILTRLRAQNIPVLLVGMKAPPNWGAEYGREFDGMYARLAKTHGATLYPFFLDGVVMDPSLNQADGIHPTKQGVKIIVDKIAPFVAGLVN